jgi:hypothetical protein
MTYRVRVDLLEGRMVHDPSGREAGRIRELVGEVVRPGSGEYVVREFHLSTGGLLEALLGASAASVISERLGRPPRSVVVGWEDLDLSNPQRPKLRRPLDELRGRSPER